MTSAATTAPNASLIKSPGTMYSDGTTFHLPSRRTEAERASRDFNAASVDWAFPSCRYPMIELNSNKPAMTAASVRFRSINSNTMAASSIHGTGAQSLFSATSSGWSVVSGTELGPEEVRSACAAASLSPSGGLLGLLKGHASNWVVHDHYSQCNERWVNSTTRYVCCDFSKAMNYHPYFPFWTGTRGC